MAGSEEILVSYPALAQLEGRLGGLARSFAGIRPVQDLSSLQAGDAGLAGAFGEFRSAWESNCRAILQELDAAGQILREAVATYRGADTSIAGSGAD